MLMILLPSGGEPGMTHRTTTSKQYNLTKDIQGRNIRYSIQIYKDVSEIYKDASTQQTSGEFIFGMS
jgi:hypothetical protein